MTKGWLDQDSRDSVSSYSRAGGQPYGRYAPNSFTDRQGGNLTEHTHYMRGGSDSSQEHSQANNQDQEELTRKDRRRIPIACGRCRKRKIRCSGSIADGACHNCRVSNTDNCQFNRVQSHVIVNEFNYDSAAALRLGMYGSAYGPPPMMIPQAPSHTPMLTHYPFTKMGSFGSGYSFDPDAQLNYGLNPQPYEPQIGTDAMGMAYAMPNTNKYFYMQPQGGRNVPTLYDNDSPTYSQPSMSYYNLNPLRTSSSVDSNLLSLGSMGSSLPTVSPTSSQDRLLPMPPPVHRTVDSSSSRGSITLSTAPQLRSMHSTSSLVQTPVNWIPITTASDGSIQTYSPTMPQPNNGSFTSSEDWSTASTTTQHHEVQYPLRSQASQPELYTTNYGRPTTATTTNPIHGDQAGSRKFDDQFSTSLTHAPPNTFSNTNEAITLSNGQIYNPYRTSPPPSHQHMPLRTLNVETLQNHQNHGVRSAVPVRSGSITTSQTLGGNGELLDLGGTQSLQPVLQSQGLGRRVSNQSLDSNGEVTLQQMTHHHHMIRVHDDTEGVENITPKQHRVDRAKTASA